MINLDDITKIYNKLKHTTGGKNASYIPQLAKVNPDLYAISIYTIDGQQFDVGDYKKEFAIESCSKVFSLALALETFGIPALKKKIGTYESSSEFNSITATDTSENHTMNSFNNGGAMATTSLLFDKDKKKFEKKIIDNMSNFAGRKLHVDRDIYNSEISNSEHNLSLAYLLKSYNRFYGDIPTTVDVYTRQCSTMVTTQDVAIMAATLANRGINPKTKKQVMRETNIPYILTHMITNGLYNESENWMTDVGMPAKSGVGGLLLIVVPGIMGIGIASPPLDKHGNSTKGIKTAKLLAKLFSKKLNYNIYFN